MDCCKHCKSAVKLSDAYLNVFSANCKLSKPRGKTPSLARSVAALGARRLELRRTLRQFGLLSGDNKWCVDEMQDYHRRHCVGPPTPRCDNIRCFEATTCSSQQTPVRSKLASNAHQTMQIPTQASKPKPKPNQQQPLKHN